MDKSIIATSLPVCLTMKHLYRLQVEMWRDDDQASEESEAHKHADIQ